MRAIVLREWSVTDALEKFQAMKYEDGDIVSHDFLARALAITPALLDVDKFALLERMDAFRTLLLMEHRIALQNVRGVGYRVVPPAQQAEYAARTAVSYIVKGLDKAGALLEHTRREVLSDVERRRHTDAEIRIGGIRGMMARQRKDIFRLFAPDGEEK